MGNQYNSIELTKEESINIIYEMQENLNRHLIQKDFAGINTYNHVSIRTIKKYWRNMTNMKKELGLELNQENMKEK